MIFPNVQIITQNKNIYFSDFYNTSIERNTQRYSYLQSYFNLQPNSAIIVVSQICKTYKKVINFIKENNIRNVYFFIDDIFRSSLENSFIKISEDYEELQKIKFIIKKTKIKNYKIYHCEVANEKLLNLNIDYADLFLNDYIINVRNYELQKKNEILYKISCLNNRGDVHRQSIGLLLCKKKDIFLTVNERLPAKKLLNNSLFDIKNLDLSTLNLICNNIDYLDNNFQNYLDPLNKDQTFLKNTIQHNNFTYDIIQKSFLNIITETCYTSPFVNISEKTIKPIICKRPFLMLGTPGSLQHLHNLGFKTFDNWWDEGYDLELDHAKRLEKVYYIADNILNKSFEDLQILLTDMEGILDFNLKHLKKISKKLLPVI